MNWRPFVIVASLMVACIINCALLYMERIPSPQEIVEVTSNRDLLRYVQYTKGQRRGNFRMFGMTDEMAGSTADKMKSYEGQKPRLVKMIKEEATVAGTVFCTADSGWPPPYAALEVLIREENARRSTLPISRFLQLDKQPWFGNAPVEGVYNGAEFARERKDDATLMGVSALLLGMEPDLIENKSPFAQAGFVGTWSFKKLQNDAKTAKITSMVQDYFSLMHFMVELANDDDDGICI